MDLPDYEKIFKTFLYPLYETSIRKRKTFSYNLEYEKNQWRTTKEIEEIQWRKLKKLLAHCYENVPFYRERMETQGIEPRDVKNKSDYVLLPILTKEDIKENYQDLIAANYRQLTRTKTTGGSTGVPMRFEFDPESDQRRNAVMWRGYRWAGIELGRRSLYLWGGVLDERGIFRNLKNKYYNLFLRRKIVDSFVLSDKTTKKMIDEINRYQPLNIVGYVASLMLVAKYIDNQNCSVHKPLSIISAAETLHEFQREYLEKVFDCPIYNTYGCREFMLIAGECEKRKGLHINSDHLLVETIDENGVNITERPGRVVITDLHNYGMPFIRYLNGDIAEINDKKCCCGRGLPMMASVNGRELDIINTPDGRSIPGEFFPHLMKEVASVDEFQVIQQELEIIKILIVSKKGLSEKEKIFLKENVQKALGQEVEVYYEYTDSIPRTNTGKLRVTLSYVNKH